jgi:hippurate hydrolase
MIEGIERVAKAAAQGARAPEPKISVDPGEFTPALYNNPALTRKTVGLFKEILGPDHLHERPVIMGGEDFSRYGKTGIPIFLYFLGTISPERMAESTKEGGKPLPSMHSDLYYPEIRPSIRTGVTTMSMAVLNLMGEKKP